MKWLVLPAEIVPKEGDVQIPTARGIPTKNGLNPIPKLGSHVNAPRLNADQGTVLKLTVFLYQLMGEAIQGQLELERADEEVLGTHGRLQK